MAARLLCNPTRTPYKYLCHESHERWNLVHQELLFVLLIFRFNLFAYPWLTDIHFYLSLLFSITSVGIKYGIPLRKHVFVQLLVRLENLFKAIDFFWRPFNPRHQIRQSHDQSKVASCSLSCWWAACRWLFLLRNYTFSFYFSLHCCR